jgi:hypothetical protein
VFLFNGLLYHDRPPATRKNRHEWSSAIQSLCEKGTVCSVEKHGLCGLSAYSAPLRATVFPSRAEAQSTQRTRKVDRKRGFFTEQACHLSRSGSHNGGHVKEALEAAL